MASSIVLAGGRSLRLGRDKTAEILGGQSIIQRVIERLAPLSQETLVVTAQGQRALELPHAPGVRLLVDIIPGKGALGGLYTGLLAASSEYSLAVACDMPFLNAHLLKYMLSLSSGFDVVIPRVGGLVEPLHAVYSKNCLAPMEDLFRRNERQIFQFYPQVRVRHVEEEEIDRFDPHRLSLFNINTPADLERARALEGK
ncbi:MAG: molybdenum cofactor guanylyltransferase [Dehalococcoidia bacterium]